MGKNYLFYKLGRPYPLLCTFTPTLRCNLKCSFCPQAQYCEKFENEKNKLRKEKHYELDTSQAKYAIDQISKAGTVILSLSGGEPLLRHDLEELALYAKKKNMLTVLHTNATLINKEKAKKLGNSFDGIIISLAGRPEINDQLRGRGQFKKAKKAARFLREHAPHTKINLNFLVSKFSVNDLEYIVDFAREYFDSMDFMPVEHMPEFFPDYFSSKKIKEKLNKLKQKYPNFITNHYSHLSLFGKLFARENHGIECDAFDLYIWVAQSGDLAGCAMYPYFVGNVLEQDIKELRTKGQKEKKKLLQKCNGCGGTIRVSLAFRQPIYETLPVINSFLQKIGVVK